MDTSAHESWEALCHSARALSGALALWQGAALNHGGTRADLPAYGLALTFAVDERGMFQATLHHDEGGREESGWCCSPMVARDLVLGVALL